MIKGKEPYHKVYEDDKHLAFLSIYPNTEGFTVVIPKIHYDSYNFDLPDQVLTELILACKKVAKLLDKKLKDVKRTGLVFEGYGVNHVHAKLFPMHGTEKIKEWRPIASKMSKKYFKKYEGYISSHDHKRADDNELKKLAKRIRSTK